MTPLLGAALELQDFFNERGWKVCIIGGIALLRWGEPRFTRDVVVSLLMGFGREDEFITPILASTYRGRIPDAAAFARRNRVLLLDSPRGAPTASPSRDCRGRRSAFDGAYSPMTCRAIWRRCGLRRCSKT